MRWSELNLDQGIWRIPGSRMKNGMTHEVALSSECTQLLRSVPRFLNCEYVFSTDGESHISGFSKTKLTLDREITRRAEQCRQDDVPGWRLHDFRRTGASRLAALGFDSVVIDKLIAHQPMKLRGIASVYQRYDYSKERRQALIVWCEHMLTLSERKQDENAA